MIETTTLTPLGHKILEHWRRHRPTMVEKLAKGNQLQQVVFAAQEWTGNQEGGLVERDGQIVVGRGNAFEPLTLPASVRARIRGMLQVRDAVREMFHTQLSDAPDEAIVEARRHLNRKYDFFTSRFGPPQREGERESVCR
jgi:hypothetical protein